MPKKPSAETELKRVKAELRKKTELVREYHDDAYGQRHRAIKAEQECSEWKRRFDLLLERTPKAEVTDV